MKLYTASVRITLSQNRMIFVLGMNTPLAKYFTLQNKHKSESSEMPCIHQKRAEGGGGGGGGGDICHSEHKTPSAA